ncbi:MAG: GDP-mannose 4,6-dehydratase [Candidatus Margulisiibacteriota bacterium]
MKKALVVGCKGQDGTLLQEYLEQMQYSVVGIDVGFITLAGRALVKDVDIENFESVATLLSIFQPDEIYYLAAFHHSAEQFVDKKQEDINYIRKSFGINTLAFANFLEAAKQHCKLAKIFYACSSHIFRGTQTQRQDEQTPVNPASVYGITKASALFLARYFRDRYQMFVSVGILYNHESSLRDSQFVSRKIVKTAVQIKYQQAQQLVLGNIGAEGDWGFAGDFVKAYHLLLQQAVSDEFIIASGQKHKVLDFVEIVFNALGLDWKKYVVQDASLVQKPATVLIGNLSKIKKITGWQATVDFREMVLQMVQDELLNCSKSN